MAEKIQKNLFNTDKGYWVRIPKAKGKTYNAWLTATDTKTRFPLWVYEIGLNFALDGSVAQSELTRSFFPHSFTQPVVGIKGQTFDQQNYRELGEFIRAEQLASVRTGKTMGLTVSGGGKSIAGRQRGPREGIAANGYVVAIETGAAFGEFSPEYEFMFAISRSHSGILGGDKPATIRRLKSWTEVFKNLNKGNAFINDPDDEWINNLLDDRNSPGTTGGH